MNTGGIFQDDGGSPELAKIQMIGFTIIAIGIFLGPSSTDRHRA